MLHGLYLQTGTIYDFPNWKKDTNGVLRQKKRGGGDNTLNTSRWENIRQKPTASKIKSN